MALPTFHERRIAHGLTLEAFDVYAEQSIPLGEIRLFDETGRANPFVVDDLLFALSELSGQHYDRTTIGGIIDILARPPASPTAPQPIEPLSEHPTLFELYLAYALDLNWIGEAMRLEDREVWQVICEPENTRYQNAALQLLRLISRYTGITYTLDTPKTMRVVDATHHIV